MPQLSEFYSDPLPLPPSLWSIFDNGSKQHADATAMTVMHQASTHLSALRPAASVPRRPNNATCLQWPFADLRHASLFVGRGLQSRGLQRGSTMATLIFNGVECAILLWVSSILQLTFVPLDPRMLEAGREGQLQDYMRRLSPAVIVVPDGSGARALDTALGAAQVETAIRIVLCEAHVSGWNALIDVATSRGSDAADGDSVVAQSTVVEQDGNRVAMILFTSGTSSGRPKGCPRTVRNVLSGHVGEFGCPNPPQRAVVHSPNSGAIAQAWFVTFGSTGREIIIPSPVFSPAGALDAIEQHGAQLLVAIPVMSSMFEKEMEARERDVSAVCDVRIGGDMVTSEAKEKFERLFPTAHVGTGHGMTEAVSVIGWKAHDTPHEYPQYHDILATGHPQSGARVRICGEDGGVVPVGEAGELHIGGPSVIDRYLEDAQPEAFYRDDRGNWLLTGDRAFMDQDGAVFIIGRIKDIIKRVGLSISPAVIESVVNRMDGVEAAVVGVPHSSYGEVPVAIVKELGSAEKAAEIKQAVKRSLGPDYALEDVKTLSDIGLEVWPFHQTGKEAKHELKGAYLRLSGGSMPA